MVSNRHILSKPSRIHVSAFIYATHGRRPALKVFRRQIYIHHAEGTKPEENIWRPGAESERETLEGIQKSGSRLHRFVVGLPTNSPGEARYTP